jgi:hypothetical protein
MTDVLDEADRSKRTGTALARLLDLTAAWLVEVGTWVYGGLMALNLVVIAALIAVGPVDTPVLISVTAFACALPLEVAGMIVLRLSKDADGVRLETLALRSFQHARFPDIEAYFPPPRQRSAVAKTRARLALGYALAIATLSLVLTLTGLLAALWHMARWVAEAALGALVLSVLLLLALFAHVMPRESEAEKRLARAPKPTAR